MPITRLPLFNPAGYVSTPHGRDMERRIYDAALLFIAEHGYPPTIRELAELVGLRSPSSVLPRLAHMENTGCIKIQPRSPRTLVLVARP